MNSERWQHTLKIIKTDNNYVKINGIIQPKFEDPWYKFKDIYKANLKVNIYEFKKLKDFKPLSGSVKCNTFNKNNLYVKTEFIENKK